MIEINRPLEELVKNLMAQTGNSEYDKYDYMVWIKNGELRVSIYNERKSKAFGVK